MSSVRPSPSEAILGFFYPEVCQICSVESASPSEGYVCIGCHDKIELISPPFCDRCGLPFSGAITRDFVCTNCKDLDLAFSSARSEIQATGVGLELVHHYKYHQALWFEPLFRRLIQASSGVQSFQGGYDAIVPVPLHREKHLEREFNQAERLADLLSASLGIPVINRWILRRNPTPTQTQLTRQERARNVQSAFVSLDPIPTSIKRIILVDDVLTTGATTHACAKVLKRGGVERVTVWTLARGI